MDDCIVVEGIETNNLKNINVALQKRAINLIIGPSGSGKSSLAYNTIAQIGQHEYLSMFADNAGEPSYIVKSYHNMVASVPIKQTNINNNMHSTIGTYFGLNRSIAFLYAALCDREESFFTLNKASNLCSECHGIGIMRKLDVNRIVDYGKPLSDNPFRCWNKYKDFYRSITTQYCESIGISPSKTFRELTPQEKAQVLHGESGEKFKITYKKTGRTASRTTRFFGVLSGHPMMPGYKPPTSFFSDVKCSCCNGWKYSSEHLQYTISDVSVGQFMTMPFNELLPFVEKLLSTTENSKVSVALDKIKYFLLKAVELNLGHLYFHRAIPTLSGGEFQRLKMVQVFNSQLNDLLIVLDEPLAGISGKEKQHVFKNVVELAKHHTVLVVDHSNAFVTAAKKIFALGPGSGRDGGRLVDSREYLAAEAQKRTFVIAKATEKIAIDIKNAVYQYSGANVILSKNAMNLISGPSGVGKSTLLREYFPQQWDDYEYISQKSLEGNSNSCVATALGIAGKIQEAFAKKTGQDKKLFSNHTGNPGTCPVCGGGGVIEFGYDARTRVLLKCEDCEGTGFNKDIKKYHLNGKSIYDIWNMTVSEGVQFFKAVDPKIAAILDNASSVLLGHLVIGQPTATLSGGENVRVKILAAAKTRSKIIGIDEPFKGLSNSEIYTVATFLDKLRAAGKTIVVIDHSEYAQDFFNNKIELTNNNGILQGKQRR